MQENFKLIPRHIPNKIWKEALFRMFRVEQCHISHIKLEHHLMDYDKSRLQNNLLYLVREVTTDSIWFYHSQSSLLFQSCIAQRPENTREFNLQVSTVINLSGLKMMSSRVSFAKSTNYIMH